MQALITEQVHLRWLITAHTSDTYGSLLAIPVRLPLLVPIDVTRYAAISDDKVGWSEFTESTRSGSAHWLVAAGS